VLVGVFPVGAHSVRIALHPVAKLAPAYLLIELGPLIVFGTVGIVVALRKGSEAASEGAGPMLALLGLALVLAFVLRVPQEPNIALRKAIKVAQLPLAAFAGVALLSLAASPRRAAWGVLAAVAILPGLVTLGTDLAQYLDLVKNRRPATTYVSRDEMDMLGWVRDNTPPGAVIQVLNPGRLFGEGTELLVPGLGQRRTFYGNDEMPAMFQVPAGAIQDRKQKLRAMFGATDASELGGVLRECPPLYVYLDERAAGPVDAVRKLEEQGVVRVVHRSGAFSLGEVVRRPADAPLAQTAAAGTGSGVK
jgi:hypothetical protein